MDLEWVYIPKHSKGRADLPTNVPPPQLTSFADT